MPHVSRYNCLFNGCRICGFDYGRGKPVEKEDNHLSGVVNRVGNTQRYHPSISTDHIKILMWCLDYVLDNAVLTPDLRDEIDSLKASISKQTGVYKK